MKLTLIIFSLLAAQLAIAQENKRNQKDVISDKRIYFYLDEEKEIKYFVTELKTDGAAKIADNDVFSLKKSTECNIFFKWLNPLSYRIAFKDTVYVSPSDIAINDYIKSYLSAFGATNTESNATTKSLTDAMNTFAVPKANGVLGYDLIVEKKAFGTKDLNLLLIQLLNSKFEMSDSVALNDLLDNLHTLEDLHTYNLAEFVSGDFNDLKNVKDYDKVSPATDAVAKNIKDKYNKTITSNEKAQGQLDPLKFVVTNKPIEAFAKVVVKDFIKEVKDKVSADKELIQKLEEINQLLIKSVSIAQSEVFKGYFKIKSIDFKDNQNFETSFIVSKYETDSKKYEIVKKSDLFTRKIIFEKYEPVKVSIGTGIFYANFSLKGFGVAQGTNKLTVTEDEIKSNTAIPATFLNFLFDFGSRNFLPILQLGADPTKKRPFILLGGGFGIPSSRFAITGGPIWTWDAKLNKLTTGQEVASSTDLEKDIKYIFDIRPKGWYAGIQYNF